MRASDVVTSPAAPCHPDMELKQAVELLVEHAFGALPVVEDSNLVGVVSDAGLVTLEVAPDSRATEPPPPTPIRRSSGASS